MSQRAARETVRILDSLPSELGALLLPDGPTEETSPPAKVTERSAVNAIELAAWDLLAERAGLPVAALWTDETVEEIDCYMSGFFLSATEAELHEEASIARRDHFRHAKVRTGRDPAEDSRRLTVVRDLFPEPESLAVDAYRGWSPTLAREFAEQVGFRLLWVEDPVPYAELHQLQDFPQPIAAGESLASYRELRALRDDAPVDVMLLDVQVLGGPTRWLSAAKDLNAAGAAVGSHVFSTYSAHLLACMDNPCPVEVFTWSDPLFETPPRPGPSGRLSIAGPGFGARLNMDTLEGLGRRIATIGF